MNEYLEYITIGSVIIGMSYITYGMNYVCNKLNEINDNTQRMTNNTNSLENTLKEFKRAYRDRGRKEDRLNPEEIIKSIPEEI